MPCYACVGGRGLAQQAQGRPSQVASLGCCATFQTSLLPTTFRLRNSGSNSVDGQYTELLIMRNSFFSLSIGFGVYDRRTTRIKKESSEQRRSWSSERCFCDVVRRELNPPVVPGCGYRIRVRMRRRIGYFTWCQETASRAVLVGQPATWERCHFFLS